MKSIDNLFAKIGSYPWRGDSDMADFDALVEAVQDEIREGYLKLPLDADGVPIRVGDVLNPPADCDDYEPLKVVRLTYDRYEEEWFFDGEAGGFCGMVGTHMDVAGWTHHHEPTVDDLLFSYGQACIRASNEAKTEAAKQTMLASLRHEYAVKLRMAGDGEGQ